MKQRVMAILLIAALIMNSNLVMAANYVKDADVLTTQAVEKKEVQDDSDSKMTGGAVLKRAELKLQKDNQVVALGFGHSAAIAGNGDLYCWGENAYGQVGNGTTQNQSKPVKILDNVVSVTSEGKHNAAITKNGDLYCWGNNGYGQIGDGTTENRKEPVKVLEDVVSVAVSDRHSVAITENGDLYCWGWNYCGEAGDGTTKKRKEPVKVLENVVSIAVADGRSAAVTRNGDLYCWGKNAYGEVGDGTTKSRNMPVKVLEDVVSVELSWLHSTAITGNGDLYCWGGNYCGEVGDGTTEDRSVPVKILEDVVTVATGGNHSAAITRKGDLYCWGENQHGEVGDGSLKNRNTPVKVLENAVSITASEYYSAAITNSGTLYCWGRNFFGQIGDGTTENRGVPVKIMEGVVLAVSQAYEGFGAHSAAIIDNGDLYCWGDNYSGQVGDGTTEHRNMPTKVLNIMSANPVLPIVSTSPASPATSLPAPLTSSVKSFTLSPNASGTPAGTLSLSGTIYLKDGTTAADSEWEKLINSIAWTSSNPSVADSITVKRPAGVGETAYNTFIVSAQAKAEGTAVITGTLPNGMTASCAVTVTKEGAGDSGEHIERHVTGKLTDVNLNLWTVTIDNTEYAVGSTEFNMSAVQANLNKTVVARLLDNQVVQLDYVGDIAEARISLALGEDKLVYENGTFDKGTMTVSVELSCGAKSPYRDSDLRGTEVEHMSVQFTGFQVDLPEDGFYVGKSSAKKKRYETSISDIVTFGSTKKYSFEVNVDTGNYYPSKAAQSLKFYASAFSADGIAGTASAGLTVGNLDISRQNAANRYADSTDGQLLSEAGALLDQLTISSVSASLSGAGLDAQQIKNVETAVKAWIVNLMVIDILRQDTSQDTGWASLWEAAGISRPETQDFIAKVAVKAFKKLGLDVSAITSVSSFMNIQGREAYTTIKVPYKDSKKKYYTIAVTMKMTTYSYTSKQPFSGFGTLSYTVTDADGICVADEFKLPVGVVTYADLETFAECVQEIGMRSIHKVYDKFMGSYLDKGKEKCRKMINENTENKLIELLTSDISNKLIEKRFGKFSDNVYKVFYGELEKKSKKQMSQLNVRWIFIFMMVKGICVVLLSMIRSKM